MLRHPIHLAEGATPILLLPPSSPTMVPIVCVPWPKSSQGAWASAPHEPPPEWITAQHVLIAYKGAAKCPKAVTRTKEEAKKRADEARAAALDGKMDFGDVAKLYSDDPNGQERLGSLGKIKRENVVKEFADVAFALKVDAISPVIETQFGFHVIKRNQ